MTIQNLLRQGASISRDRNINPDYAKVADEAADRIDALEAERDALKEELEEWRFTNRIDELQRAHDALAAKLAALESQEPKQADLWLTKNKLALHELLSDTAAGAKEEPVGFNGLTKTETDNSMSVRGLSKKDPPYVRKNLNDWRNP